MNRLSVLASALTRKPRWKDDGKKKNNDDTNFSVEVFDISGRIVFEDYYTQSSNLEQTISIDKPSSGVYFVNVKSGSAITTEKIIVQ